MESTACSSRPHGSPADDAAADGQVVPPYWQRHLRDDSVVSVVGNNPFIKLVDNTEEGSEQSKALWAKSAEIDDHVVVRGTAPGIGDYVVWNCKIETLNGGVMTLNKRYSEFDKLRKNLVKTFPQSEGSIPPLPPKSVVSKFQTTFLDKRREGLAYFLNCVLLNPEFAGSPVIKDFLFT